MIDRFGLLPEAAKNLFRLTELKLKAAPLGIRKIEAGPAGGRLLFAAQPAVDPVAVINLIQRESRTYRLDGQEKLRFGADLENVAARFDFVHALLDRLKPAVAAVA